MQRYSIYLPANERVILGVVGNFFRIFTATGNITVETEAKNSGGSNHNVSLPENMSVTLPEKDTFQNLSFTTSTAQTLIVYAGYGRIEDDRLTVSGSVDVSPGDTITDTLVSAGTTATLLCAADASRHEVTFQNRGANTVYIGSSSVDTTKGIAIDPGNYYTVGRGAKGAWYGIVAAATENVAVQTIT